MKDTVKTKAHNAQIRNAILDGSYFYNITRSLNDSRGTLERIGLWGAEPSLNFDVAKDFLFALLDWFGNIKSVFFSTNAYGGYDSVAALFVYLAEYNRQQRDAGSNRRIALQVQLSLDGPAWINDASRKKGATDTTLDVLRQLVTRYAGESLLKTELSIKATLEVAHIKKLLKVPDGVHTYFQFFDDLQKECMTLRTVYGNMRLALATAPTIVSPGEHTSGDGRVYAQFVRAVRQIDTNQFEYMRHPLLAQGLRLLMLMDEHKEGRQASGFASCSAGNSTVSIDKDGNLYTCHRLLGDLVNGVPDTSVRAYVARQGPQFKQEQARFEYLSQSYHCYPASKRQFWEAELLALAAAGQVTARVLTDWYYKELLWLMCGDVLCHLGAVDDMTGDQMIPPSTYTRLWGNGALDEFLLYIREMWDRDGRIRFTMDDRYDTQIAR